jgi:anti-sigma factor RsiW
LIYTERLKEWLDQIYEPVEREISCRELVDQLPAHIDAIVQGQNPNGEFGDLQEHMAACPDCSQLYAELVHLAVLEEEGRLPEVDELIVELAGEASAVPAV